MGKKLFFIFIIVFVTSCNKVKLDKTDVADIPSESPSDSTIDTPGDSPDDSPAETEEEKIIINGVIEE